MLSVRTAGRRYLFCNNNVVNRWAVVLGVGHGNKAHHMGVVQRSKYPGTGRQRRAYIAIPTPESVSVLNMRCSAAKAKGSNVKEKVAQTNRPAVLGRTRFFVLSHSSSQYIFSNGELGKETGIQSQKHALVEKAARLGPVVRGDSTDALQLRLRRTGHVSW